MIEAAIAVILLVLGLGAVGIGLAWLNDVRLSVAMRRPPADPKAILEERFARGEIDDAEFARRMHRLVYGPPLELGDPD
jgi:uncharacterized membrane protein